MTSEGFYQPSVKDRVEEFINLTNTEKQREEPVSSNPVKLSADPREKPKPVSF